jgi:hypothetical protein
MNNQRPYRPCAYLAGTSGKMENTESAKNTSTLLTGNKIKSIKNRKSTESTESAESIKSALTIFSAFVLFVLFSFTFSSCKGCKDKSRVVVGDGKVPSPQAPDATINAGGDSPNPAPMSADLERQLLDDMKKKLVAAIALLVEQHKKGNTLHPARAAAALEEVENLEKSIKGLAEDPDVARVLILYQPDKKDISNTARAICLLPIKAACTAKFTKYIAEAIGRPGDAVAKRAWTTERDRYRTERDKSENAGAKEIAQDAWKLAGMSSNI